jgi:hypothetical protein
MGNKTKAVTETEELEVPKLSEKKEKRDKLIRIRTYNYDRLSRLGTLSEDWDDALTKVLDYWEEGHKQND